MARAVQFFFLHLGLLVAIVVYFALCDRAAYAAEGVRQALLAGLLVQSGYLAVAYWQGYLKQFDVGLWVMFALGTLGTRLGSDAILFLFQRYSPAILFATLAVTAFVPLLLGREPFTVLYARHQTPAWVQKLPAFMGVTRLLAGYWGFLFVGAAALCLRAPTDWRFTFLYPNLLVFGAGLPGNALLPRLHAKLFPPALPRAIEPLIMGLPFAFDRTAAGDSRATIQFCVSGAEAGDWFVRVGGGRCESFVGVAPTADLTVRTPDTVWARIVHGELDGERALLEGEYHVEGDVALWMKFADWFPPPGGRQTS